jgi:hypothetical protein
MGQSKEAGMIFVIAAVPSLLVLLALAGAELLVSAVGPDELNRMGLQR